MNVLEIRKTIYVYNIIASVDKRLIVWFIFNLIAKNIKNVQNITTSGKH